MKNTSIVTLHLNAPADTPATSADFIGKKRILDDFSSSNTGKDLPGIDPDLMLVLQIMERHWDDLSKNSHKFPDDLQGRVYKSADAAGIVENAHDEALPIDLLALIDEYAANGSSDW